MHVGEGQAKRPNILLLYADQWRGDALGCAGDPVVQTPALDRLAASGLHLPSTFTVDPVCTPSRAALLTGRYPHVTGVTHNDLRLPENEVSFAQVFAAAGYRTGYIGKWHLDGEEKPGFVPPGPRRHGFGYWAAFNRGHAYHAPIYYRDTAEPIATDAYEPDLQTDLACAFLEEADPRPFCLVVAWGPPHTPLQPPARTAARYRAQDMPVPPGVPPAEAERARSERARYYGLITSLDENVDRLLQTLDRHGASGNTVVCFTADHGDLLGEHGLYRKGRPEEPSIRVPLLLRWPGTIPTGVRADLAVASIDLCPTLLGLAGLSAPAGVQGRDLSACLRGVTAAPTDPVYIEGRLGAPDEWRALRTAQHLIAVGTASGEITHLFDLEQDPYELENLACDPNAAALRRALWEQLAAAATRTSDQRLRRPPGLG